jgi:hypothetical protein
MTAIADQVARVLDAEDAARRGAIIEERTGVIAQVLRHRAAVATAVRRGTMTMAEGELVNRQMAAFAEDIAIGLHVESATCATVRDAMRPLVKGLKRGG